MRYLDRGGVFYESGYCGRCSWGATAAARIRLLGAQIVGYEGVDKRIDVLATAIRAGLKATELKDLGLAYACGMDMPDVTRSQKKPET